MSFTEKFVKQEQGNFEQFDEFIGSKLMSAYAEAIALFMAQELQDKDSAELRLPHGTYTASVRERGESYNTNVALEFAKDFIKYINGDIDKLPIQDSFNPTFLKMFINLTGFGHIDPESKEGKAFIEENKIKPGIALQESEAEYFLNDISQLIGDVAKEYEKPDKVYKFDIENHGEFEFTYGEKTSARFTADKVFKHKAKDDAKMNA